MPLATYIRYNYIYIHFLVRYIIIICMYANKYTSYIYIFTLVYLFYVHANAHVVECFARHNEKIDD